MFENRSTFAEVIIKQQVADFFERQCIVTLYLYGFLCCLWNRSLRHQE